MTTTPDVQPMIAAMENLGRAFRAIASTVNEAAKNFGILAAQECGYVLRTKPLLHNGKAYRA